MSSKPVYRSTHIKPASAAKLAAALVLLAALLAAQVPPSAQASGAILFVATGGMTYGSCNSWLNACNLEYAIGISGAGDQLWVKQGTYEPLGSRNDSFTLKTAVAIYGGFRGDESLLAQRNPARYPSILSGDIGIAGDASDNSYHVVNASGTDSTAVLDGFTITHGNANGTNPADQGAGIYDLSGNGASLDNLIVTANSATYEGGGMYAEANGPALRNVTFSDNAAALGGGMANISGYAGLENVTFSGNSAVDGGGMYNSADTALLDYVTFSGNSVSASGGGLYCSNCNTAIYDSIFWNDGSEFVFAGSTIPTITDSLVAGGCPPFSTCVNVIGSDPLLGPLANNGGFTPTMALAAGSPAIDTGGPDAGCILVDQRGVSRPQGPHCDMGAYEAPVTVTYRSSGAQDGWVLESAETSGMGGSLNSTTGPLILGDDTTNRQYRSVLSFATAALPDNAMISSVTLKLKYASVSPPASNPITLLKGILLDVRTGFFGSSPNLQLGDFQAAGTTSTGPFMPALSAGYYSLQLGSGSFAAINKLSSNGGLTQIRLRFKLDDNNDLVANTLNLVSGNNANPSNRPALIIVYTTP